MIPPSTSVLWQKAGVRMVRRVQPTTFQERLEILERATSGQSDSEIAASLHCSIWTVRKWGEPAWLRLSAGLQLGRLARSHLSSVMLFSRCAAAIWAGDQI